MDVQFDNAQELNSFHVKARGLFKCIDGVQLHLQTIKVEVDSEIVPLLYLRNSAQFSQYKHILFNHIQTMLNFHLSKCSDGVISRDPEYPDCLFEGSKLGLDFHDFVNERKCHTLAQMQQQLPIKTTIRFSKPTPFFWHSFSQSSLGLNYLRLRLALDDCGGSIVPGKRSIIPYHIRTLDFRNFKLEPRGITLKRAIKDKLDYAPPSFWESDDDY